MLPVPREFQFYRVLQLLFVFGKDRYVYFAFRERCVSLKEGRHVPLKAHVVTLESRAKEYAELMLKTKFVVNLRFTGRDGLHERANESG
jgi:hypothetical protein